MNILFICKHNKFRSKVAEALFLLYNKDRDIKVRSAGIQMDFLDPLVSINTKRVLAEFGAGVVDNRSRPIDNILLKWADLFVVVADDVSAEEFPEEKTEVWGIADADRDNIEEVRRRVKEINLRIRDFIRRLEACY